MSSTILRSFRWGANFKVIGKTDPQKLSYAGCWENVQGSLQDLATHIGKGHPWMPALLDGNRKRWQSNANYAELLSLDIDGGMTIDEALANPLIANQCGLGIESSSSTPEHHKFRLIFPLTTPVKGFANIKICNTYLQHLVGSADKSCKDASRFYFGALGREPFLIQDDVTLPADFLDQALAWQQAIDTAKAEEQRKRAEERLARLEQLTPGDLDPESLIEQANDRLGADAFLRYLEAERHSKGEKIRCKPAFRKGSGSYSAFVSQSQKRVWLYHDPTEGHSCDGFRFYCWQERGEGYKPRGAEFWELLRGYCSIAGIDVPEFEPKGFGEIKTKPKSKAQQKRERKKIQADITRKAILKPFGDRQYDIVCRTNDELVTALLNHTHCFIDGPTGSGKTEAIAQFMKQTEGMNLIYLSPVRSLAKGAAKTTGLPYLNDYSPGVLDGCTACIHSAHKVFSTPRLYDKDCIFLDEPEQCLEAQIAGDLCMENRAEKLGMTNQGFREAPRFIAASATATLKDLNYLETVTGKKFVLIRFDPKTHKKGKVKVITGQSGVKGSDKAAKAMLISKIGDRQHIYTDSLNKTIDFGIRLEEKGVTHEIINSRTANEKLEVKDFLGSTNPGQHWLESGFSTLITNPAVQSGFSIKNPEGVKLFDEVLGHCTGGSVSPGTAFQGLVRYRDNCDRTVYAPNFANPRSKLCRGRAPRGFGTFAERQKKQWDTDHDHLEQQVRSGNSSLKDFKMLTGAEKDWYQQYEIQMKREFSNYAVALAAYAERDGYTVERVHPDKEYIVESKRDEVYNRKASPIAEAKPIDTEQFKYLIEKPEPTQAELDQIDAYLIRDYFGLDWDAPLTKDLVITENFGDGRKALKHAQRLLWDGQAGDDDAKRTEKLGFSGYLWDTTNYALSLHWWTLLGIDQLLAHCMKNPYSSLSPEIREFGDRLSRYEPELGEGSRLLGIAIPVRGDDAEAYYAKIVRWIGMQLKRLGISTQSKRVKDEDGKLLPRVYQVRQSDIDALKAVLRFKLETQLNKGFQPRSTPLQEIFYFGVDLKIDDSSPPQSFVDFYRKRLEKIYDEALQGDDIPLIERIGLQLDKVEAFI